MNTVVNNLKLSYRQLFNLFDDDFYYKLDDKNKGDDDKVVIIADCKYSHVSG